MVWFLEDRPHCPVLMDRGERERMFPAFEIFSGTWEYISFALEHEKEASFYLYTWVQGHEAEQVRGQNIT